MKLTDHELERVKGHILQPPAYRALMLELHQRIIFLLSYNYLLTRNLAQMGQQQRLSLTRLMDTAPSYPTLSRTKTTHQVMLAILRWMLLQTYADKYSFGEIVVTHSSRLSVSQM